MSILKREVTTNRLDEEAVYGLIRALPAREAIELRVRHGFTRLRQSCDGCHDVEID